MNANQKRKMAHNIVLSSRTKAPKYNQRAPQDVG